MSIRFKIFAAACFVCAVAWLADFHLREMSAQPVTEKKDAPNKLDLSPDAAARDDFLRFEAQARADSPVTDLSIGEKLLEDDPADTNGRAGNFLLSLCDAGQFQLALQFANEAPPDLKPGWLQAVFSRWAQTRPEAAMSALDSITDDSERTSLFQSIAAAWAGNNPSEFADFAESLPDGDNKAYALNEVVKNWSLQDPESFSNWLNTTPSGVNLDQAIAEMISKTDSANRTPQTAMEWVENINDPKLRYNSLVFVLGQWNENDPTGAQAYLNNVTWLDDSQRQEIIENLQSSSKAVIASDGD